MTRFVHSEQVKLFLEQFKRLVRAGRWQPYGKKRKNLEALFELGISIQEWKEHLLELKPDDFKGVTDEHNRCQPNRWVFQKVIQGRNIYIRLHTDPEQRMAFCESFHP